MVKFTRSTDRRFEFVEVGPAYIGKLLTFENGAVRLFHLRHLGGGRTEHFITDFDSREEFLGSLEPSEHRSSEPETLGKGGATDGI